VPIALGVRLGCLLSQRYNFLKANHSKTEDIHMLAGIIKKNHMSKTIKIFLIIVISLIGLIFFVNYIYRQAFGPTSRTLEIELNDKMVLSCKETYMADLAAVFYDVDFSLLEKNKSITHIGSASFTNQDWVNDIKLKEIENWIILPVKHMSNAKLLMVDLKSKNRIDTIFSTQELRYDKLWKAKYKDIPDWTYDGETHIDSIVENRIYVNYHYRVTQHEKFKFYNQTIEYGLDTRNGKIMTRELSERIKNNAR
jgi:hypothetical protein